MVDDDFHEALLRNQQGKKPYRRKRVHHAEVFSGQKSPTLQDINKGLWCRSCKERHPYNGPRSKRLALDYEKRGEARVLLWICPYTGNVVDESYLGDTRSVNVENGSDQEEDHVHGEDTSEQLRRYG